MICGKDSFEAGSERKRELWMMMREETEELEMMEAEGEREESKVE